MDGHDRPHRIVQVDPLVGAGASVVLEQSDDETHVQVVLVDGEGPREVLGCWEDPDAPVPLDQWGVPLGELPCLLRHLAWHVALGVPPSSDCSWWD